MNRFKLLFVFACILFCGVRVANAQNNTGVIALSPKDTLICPGQTITLHGKFASDFGQITNDDIFSDQIVDIGFPFTFFGNVYTQCVISANNFISFDLNYAGQYSSFVYNAGNKSNTQLGNSIMFPFHDINMGLGQGTISFQTFGQAPNRTFVVEFCKTPLFSCSAMLVTDQLILYEGSNVIEHHIGDKPVCTAWQQGTGIQGLIGNNGANEVFAPGRGTINTPWTAALDGRRFTPNGAGTYLIDTIPYNPRIIIPNVDSNDIIWYEEGNPISIGTGASITVTPTAQINYYVARITGQNGCLGTSTYSFYDTVWINYGTAYDTTDVEICAGTTYSWFGRDLFKAGNYDTLLNTTLGCDSFLRMRLAVNPLPDVTIKGSANVAICEGSATTLALANPGSNSTFQWYKNNIPVAGETGSQMVVNEVGSYTVQATTDKGCQATSVPFTLTINPNPQAEIKPITGDVICAYDSLKLEAVEGTAYDYRWSPEKPFRIVTGAEGQKVEGVFLEPTLVTLTVYNQYGCYDTATTMVYTKPCCEVFTPNAFSPNGDGNNDYFNPKLQLGQILLTMQVFDRYGKLVYNNTNIKKGWDGKYENGAEAGSDVYMYFIKYTCADGKLYEKKESVSLIR
jgi:gliding motility-associated-like protein